MIKLNKYNVLCVLLCAFILSLLYIVLPLHLTLLGSGSHCPSSMQADESGPMRTKSSEHLKITNIPGVAGSLKFVERLLELLDTG